ncbi:hypothetical protein CEXT_281251 [Caerostris extrusa]|uniref:Uncharacterized protein n=1 Tax=Caerostris extrusa TaxID=172846 RepID=A0AAV4Y9S0_CAEEX|nr:hypothetical protein CEXT_281251 [Caerostris extrusa]
MKQHECNSKLSSSCLATILAEGHLRNGNLLRKGSFSEISKKEGRKEDGNRQHLSESNLKRLVAVTAEFDNCQTTLPRRQGKTNGCGISIDVLFEKSSHYYAVRDTGDNFSSCALLAPSLKREWCLRCCDRTKPSPQPPPDFSPDWHIGTKPGLDCLNITTSHQRLTTTKLCTESPIHDSVLL